MGNANLTDLAIQRLKEGTWWDTNLPSFGIRIGKRRKTFLVRIGRERREVTIGHYPDLALKAARSRAKVEMTQVSTPATKTLSEASRAFLDEAATSTKPNTLRVYRHYLSFFNFTTYPTRQDIEKKLAELNPSAQNLAHATLRTFLNWCMKKGHIESHPLIRSEAPNRLKSRERVLSDDELVKIWHACTGNYGNLVRILMLTGLRRTEPFAAHLSHLITIGDTKNNNPHILPLTPLVAEHFPVSRVTNWSAAKAKLDTSSSVTDWRLHDLRRTLSTNLAMRKVPIHVTEHILNHRSGTVSGIVRTYNRYGYLAEMEEALLLWEQHIRTITSA